MRTSQKFLVQGMTCGHCVDAVTSEVKAIPGVNAVVIDLVADGASILSIESDGPVAAASVATAVDEAGYTLVDSPQAT